MTAYVEECRQEWKRLGVPDLLAEEMATELESDLAEARADGVSATEILGESDPRRFAATWASERGLVAEPAPPRKTRRRWILDRGRSGPSVPRCRRCRDRGSVRGRLSLCAYDRASLASPGGRHSDNSELRRAEGVPREADRPRDAGDRGPADLTRSLQCSGRRSTARGQQILPRRDRGHSATVAFRLRG
jgi:hypothetical protein